MNSTSRNAIEYALTFPTAYTRAELSLLWKAVEAVPLNGTIVEYGVDYGASSSLFFQRSERIDYALNIVLVDNRVMNPIPAWRRFTELLCDFPRVPFTFYAMDSRRASVPLSCDLLHVDAGHSYEDTHFELRATKARVVVLHDWERSEIYSGIAAAARGYFGREPDELAGYCALYWNY